MTRRLAMAMVLGASLGSVGCSAELGEPCSFDSQCPEGSVCRNNLYLEALCSEGIAPTTGPDGYCTHVCVTDEDCQDLPHSKGCLHDPQSDRKLCLPDCRKYLEPAADASSGGG
ncbi:MAG: hypothetical protein JXR83_05610 [Deltaproteobacteria bacterium]|nr:hypothetical protein [Deltaproteobacteria bacterium]